MSAVHNPFNPTKLVFLGNFKRKALKLRFNDLTSQLCPGLYQHALCGLSVVSVFLCVIVR